MPQALVSGGKSRLPLYRKADSYVERCSLSVGDKLKGTVSGDFKIARSAVIRAPQQMLQSRLGLQRSVIELSVAVRMRSGFRGPGLSSLCPSSAWTWVPHFSCLPSSVPTGT